jgi:hypothetical protein
LKVRDQVGVWDLDKHRQLRAAVLCGHAFTRSVDQ